MVIISVFVLGRLLSKFRYFLLQLFIYIISHYPFIQWCFQPLIIIFRSIIPYFINVVKWQYSDSSTPIAFISYIPSTKNKFSLSAVQ